MAKKKAKTAKKKTRTGKKPTKKKASRRAEQPKTTAQQLATLVKSARDIMRKDKGLNGDLDRLPLLTWIMFLKFLDDREKLEEARAGIASKKYKSAVEAPYRWCDWAATKDGIHFDSSEEIHTLARLYESMLREMRDAAGDSGEFYTPRPVIQFMVSVTDPQLREMVLDPACGTGGFLAEAFSHLEKQCDKAQDRKVLQQRSIRGGEAKPLPYMLSQMNLLLHGLDAPAIEYGNSLAVKITELGQKDRVDIILTNPPFGGEEEAGIRGNFPADKQTSETALLFLQLIMRRLRKPRTGNERGGRAGVVVPNGTLFGDGVAARIKEELLKDFNLHTVVRLPFGVFSPYADIPTNLLFFDRSGPTKDIWYYETPLPEGRKKYSKTNPMRFDEFADCLKWFQLKRRRETEHAWRVSADDLLIYDESGSLVSCNLDIKNPHSVDALEHLPPEQLADDILAKERRIMEIMEEIKAELGRAGA